MLALDGKGELGRGSGEAVQAGGESWALAWSLCCSGGDSDGQMEGELGLSHWY